MKKAKTETGRKTFNDSFSENETFSENRNLSFINNSEISQTEEFATFTEKSDSLLNLLKQIFFFLPGAFLLYLISFVVTIILIDSLSAREPAEIFGIHSAPLQILLLGTIAFFGIFMIWFGLGDLKNKKHFAIPISVIVAGGIIALISKILSDLFGFTGLFEVINYYFIYLFPLILILPVLVKGWIDRKTEDA